MTTSGTPEKWRRLTHFRSLLVVPADDAKKVECALQGAADAVMFDLEDFVPDARKELGRELLVEHLGEPRSDGPLRVVRINAAGSPHMESDVLTVGALAIDAVAIPAATPKSVGACAALGLPVVAIVETAAGVLDARGVAREECVTRIVLGGKDLAADVGLLARADQAELLAPRALLALASRAAGLGAPIDVVCPDRSIEGLAAQMAVSRSLGFGGKAAVHEQHIAPINALYGAERAELEIDGLRDR